MEGLEKYRQLVENEISSLPFPEKPVNLYEPICYFLSLGGKRMRPILTLMATEMFGGKMEKSVPAAVAMELVHNFSLVHDDIMDKAPLRRGKPTVHEKWNANTAILSGDAILIEAYRMLSKSDVNYLPAVLEIFNRTATEVCEGQVMDMDFEKRNDVTVEAYIEMIRLKTAVLLGGCLKIGAVLGGANEKDAQLMYDIGIHLGIAFQLQDDLLDAYGDPEKFGKAVGGDIAANKKTYLLLKTMELATEADKKHLQNLLHLQSPDKINRVLEWYGRYSIKDLSETEITRHFNSALSALGAISLSENTKAPIKTIVFKLLNRNH